MQGPSLPSERRGPRQCGRREQRKHLGTGLGRVKRKKQEWEGWGGVEHWGAEACQTSGFASTFCGRRESGREEVGALVGGGRQKEGRTAELHQLQGDGKTGEGQDLCLDCPRGASEGHRIRSVPRDCFLVFMSVFLTVYTQASCMVPLGLGGRTFEAWLTPLTFPGSLLSRRYSTAPLTFPLWPWRLWTPCC